MFNTRWYIPGLEAFTRKNTYHDNVFFLVDLLVDGQNQTSKMLKLGCLSN